VWLTATLAAGSLLAWLLPVLGSSLVSPPPADRFEEWLVAGCGAVAVAAAGWLWLLVSLVVVEAATATRSCRRGIPPGLRRLVLAACGAGLVGGLAGPVHATVPPSPLDGLPLPDRASSAAAAHVPRDRSAPGPVVDRNERAVARIVRVAPGDTLWDLAETRLPGNASDADVDAHWRVIHARNRSVIGSDPDLILPGQRLQLPPPAPSPPPA
jgi:hypothetical protein